VRARAFLEAEGRNGLREVVPGVPSASLSSAEAVALRRFRAARRAGEPDLFMAMLDFYGPDAHRRVAAVTLWVQHTRVDDYRLSLHIPSLQP
jgi:hypothetical protein